MMTSHLCTIVHVWLVLVKRQGIGKTNPISSHAGRDVSLHCRQHGS